ncbi:DUF2057 family protein [Vibrio taketomensis]|uniref:YccT family protein n=1 Tax=Vibrio taketomensis TaxID=2572923 RepID=UPI001389DC0B|nr:DUF2057 family protein [Vibrio taketomensis]
MKLIKSLLAIGVMTTSFTPYAEVGLNFHRDLTPIIVEGEEMGLLTSAKGGFQLDNGTNQFVFRMAKLIESNGGEREKFNSHAFVVSFDAQDTKVVLEPTMRVIRENESIEFNRNPRVALVDQSGKSVDFTIDMLPAAGDTLFGRDYTADLAKYNKQHGIIGHNEELAAEQVAVVQAAPITVSDAPVKVVTINAGEIGPVAMVQYWMEKATPAEAEQFTDWAFDNRATKSMKALEGSKPVEMLSYWYSEAELEQRKQILAWLISR